MLKTLILLFLHLISLYCPVLFQACPIDSLNCTSVVMLCGWVLVCMLACFCACVCVCVCVFCGGLGWCVCVYACMRVCVCVCIFMSVVSINILLKQKLLFHLTVVEVAVKLMFE